MNQIQESWISVLNSQGYRLTKPRAAVIHILAQSDRALNPTQIFLKAHRQYPSLGFVTVYRTLEKLEELQLIQKVFLEDGNYAYFPKTGGHSHLLICQHCNRTEVFSGDDLKPLFSKLDLEIGFEVKEHLLQLVGVCAKCKQRMSEEI